MRQREISFMASYKTDIFSASVSNGMGTTTLIGYYARFSGCDCMVKENDFVISQDNKVISTGSCKNYIEGMERIAEMFCAKLDM